MKLQKVESVLKREAELINRKSVMNNSGGLSRPKFILESDFDQFANLNNLINVLVNNFNPQLLQNLPGSVFKCECTYQGNEYSFSVLDLNGKVLSVKKRGFSNSKINSFSFFAVKLSSKELVEEHASVGGGVGPKKEVTEDKIILFDYEFSSEETNE